MITIKIGVFERNYTAVKTNAPERYDYSGTIRVIVPGYGTVTLVHDDQIDIQCGRYASGLYDCQTAEYIPSEDLTEAVYRKLIKNE